MAWSRPTSMFEEREMKGRSEKDTAWTSPPTLPRRFAPPDLDARANAPLNVLASVDRADRPCLAPVLPTSSASRQASSASPRAPRFDDDMMETT